jgi:hypothetical protein
MGERDEHIATGRALSLGGELLHPHHESQQRQRRCWWSRWRWLRGQFPIPAGCETSVPQNWSSMAVALRNFLWMDADSFRVFALEGIYRRKGDVRGHPGGPHHMVARPGAPTPPPASWPFSVSPLDSVYVTAK